MLPGPVVLAVAGTKVNSEVTFTPTEDFGIYYWTFDISILPVTPALPALQISLVRSMVHAEQTAAQFIMAAQRQKLTAQAGGQTILPPPFTFTYHKRPSTGLRRRYRDCASSLLLRRNRLSFLLAF